MTYILTADIGDMSRAEAMNAISDPEKMKALTIAAKCADAYSADMWGLIAWVQAAQMLVDMGLAEEEVEGVLRSKLTRWARDAYGEPSTYLGQLAHQVSVLQREKRLHEYL